MSPLKAQPPNVRNYSSLFWNNIKHQIEGNVIFFQYFVILAWINIKVCK